MFCILQSAGFLDIVRKLTKRGIVFHCLVIIVIVTARFAVALKNKQTVVLEHIVKIQLHMIQQNHRTARTVRRYSHNHQRFRKPIEGTG